MVTLARSPDPSPHFPQPESGRAQQKIGGIPLKGREPASIIAVQPRGKTSAAVLCSVEGKEVKMKLGGGATDRRQVGGTPDLRLSPHPRTRKTGGTYGYISFTHGGNQ